MGEGWGAAPVPGTNLGAEPHPPTRGQADRRREVGNGVSGTVQVLLAAEDGCGGRSGGRALFNVTRALDERPWAEREQRGSMSREWVGSTKAQCTDALELMPWPGRWAFPGHSLPALRRSRVNIWTARPPERPLLPLLHSPGASLGGVGSLI